MICEIAGSERRIEDRSIVLVEVTEDGADAARAWEFHCDACDEMLTGLDEETAVKLLDTHVCPDMPPCETFEQ